MASQYKGYTKIGNIILGNKKYLGVTLDDVSHDVLEGMSRRIINEIDGINRVVYDISSKPPATIEWE